MSKRKPSKQDQWRFSEQVSRYDFLKYSLAASASPLFFDPVRMLMGALVDGVIQNAQAQQTGVTPKKYLALILNGGPPRWVFDLPLQAQLTDQAPGNPMVKTKMSGTSQIYETVGMGAYQMPSLWSTGLPMSSGDSTASMLPLAENALMIRGVRGINSHQASRAMATRPDMSAPSLNGLVADHSHASIPAVNLLALQTFKSYSGIGEFRTDLKVTSNDNPLFRTLGPFIENRPSHFFSRKDLLDIFVKDAMSALRSHHESGTPGVKALYENSDKAEKQILQGVGDLSTAYAELFNKYTDIINRVATASDWNSKLGFDLSGLSFMSQAEKVQNLAGVFAITEYLFSNGYSSTVHAAVGYMPGIDSDAHNENADVHLRAFSFYFRSIAACIHELSRSLPDWENTVVQVGSEFPRTPRVNSSGSDHGWEGINTTIFSGAIKGGPFIAGNIKPDSGTRYTGVWGMGANVEIDRAQKTLGMGNVASAIAHIVGVRSPTANFASPIFLSPTGQIHNLIGTPRLIT